MNCSINEFIDVINSLETSKGFNLNKLDQHEALQQEFHKVHHFANYNEIYVSLGHLEV